MTSAYIGIDIGSISTKGVIDDADRRIIARSTGGPKATRPKPPATSSPTWQPDRPRDRQRARRRHHRQRPPAHRRHRGAKDAVKADHRQHRGHHLPASRRANHFGNRRAGLQDHLRGGRHRRGLRHEHAVRRRNGSILVQPGTPAGRGGGGVRRDSSRVEEAGEHRRTLHRVRRERPCPQDPGGLRARGHRCGAVPCRGDELPEQRRQGQEDRRARGVPRWREQEPRRGEGVRGRAGNGGAGRPRRAPDGRVRGRAAGRRGRAAHANGRC